MRNEISRARSHAHAGRRKRFALHTAVALLAISCIAGAAYAPQSTAASTPDSALPQSLTGITGFAPDRGAAVFRPPVSQVTHGSVVALTVRGDVRDVRASAAISPLSSFSAGVSVAAAASGDENAGVAPLAEVVDPTRPFILHETAAGESVEAIAAQYGLEAGVLLDNNPTALETVQPGQEILIPRAPGILHKVAHGETVESIVAQYDNITVEQTMLYRPNALRAGETLEAGRFVLLPGARRKPPPPPPPEPEPAPAPVPSNPSVPSSPSAPANPGGGGSTQAPPATGSRFSLPLNRWHGISDPFGTYRGVNRIHEGIDLDLYGLWSSPIFSSCDGVVSSVEYLTYSYGYYVIVDCGEGWTTLYAHMSVIHVSSGQRVSQGTQLGLSGVTGYTTGEHLHFEIRYFGAPVNPANYINFY